MIGHQQKSSKKPGTVKLSGVHKISSAEKARILNESGMTYNPELDKFSGDERIPEKHEVAEIRLANSILPPFK